jgi:O-antigen ligase
VSDSHNIPVTVAAEQGAVGLLLYVALIVSALLTLLGRARNDPFRIGLVAGAAALLLHTMFYADFLEDPTTWALLAIGAALASSAQAAAETERRDRRRLRRAVA